jgi:phenylalanyl-tRNA synthetase beta chain
MRLPFGWLQDYVKIDVSPEEACDYLIMLGFADARVVPNEWDCLDGFVVGRAVDVAEVSGEPHLKVVNVNVGYTTVTSVCGAPNVKAGQLYAVAMPGAKLGSGQTVSAAAISGVESRCVLCSGWEAWLDDSREELLELGTDIAPGTKLIEALGLEEPVIEMEVTPNRADCLGLIGVAREIAAVFGKELMIPEPALSENGSAIDDLVSVEILDREACPRYGGIALEGVEVRGSRAAVRARLRLAGLRPINNVVDATNIVLYETGHPLHAFDLDRLAGGRIIVRRARSGERLLAIDGKDYKLAEEDLVIADAEKAVALAGVIGGENSEVTHNTTRVLIEGAFFERGFVWRTSKRLGIASEAAYRFARTVDVGAVLYVLARTAAMIQKDTECRVSSGMVDVYPDPIPTTRLFVSPKRINRLLGTSVPEQEICDYLERLGFLVSPGKDLEVIVPTRRRDVESEADIAEEVGRLYGYDRIDATTSRSCESYGRLPVDTEIQRRARNALSGLGLCEAVTDVMIGPEILIPYDLPTGNLVEVRNPVGVQNSVLRNSLVQGIVGVLLTNERRGQDGVAVFELGKAYFKEDGDFREITRLCIGLSGLRQERAWYSAPAEYDFYDLKGILEGLAEYLGVELLFSENTHKYLHPGRRTSISMRIDGTEHMIGFLGEIAPPVCETLGSRRRLYVAECDFDMVLGPAVVEKTFRALDRFPAVKRDIAIIVSKQIANSSIREAIIGEGGSLVESAEIFDIYEGEQIPEGTKSLAYGIVFRSPTQTLTEDEVDKLQKKIEKRVIKDFEAKIRMGQ